MWAFIKKWRTKAAVKCEHFYTRFDEEWEVLGRCDRTKGYELSVVSWGKPSKAFSFKFSVPQSSEIRLLFSSGYNESTSCLRVSWPASGEIRESFHHMPFLDYFSLKHSRCQDAIFWSSVSWTQLRFNFLQLSQNVLLPESGFKQDSHMTFC